MTDSRWNPDLEVAVHEDELIVRFDHLPMEEVDLQADWEDGGVVLHDDGAVHCFHVSLPANLDLGTFEARPNEGTFELRVHVPS
jgi:hypothetical protein